VDGLVKPLGLLQAEAPPLGQHLLLQACRTVALSATVGQIQKTRLEGGFFVFGALGWIRTTDRPVRSRVLYPAELRVPFVASFLR
tara:strand:+ start:13486 stop:13740 length:255 start_codon:yes stop_codon:yes gene_type:complete